MSKKPRTDEDRAKAHAYYLRIREHRQKNGLCYRCGRTAKSGCILCPICIERKTKRQRITHKERVAKGLCRYCCRPWSGAGQTCDSCKPRARKASSRAKAKRKSDGVCISCPNPTRPGKDNCQACADKASAKYKQIVQSRKSSGVCTLCGTVPPIPNSQQHRCTTCYLKHIAKSRKMPVASVPAIASLFNLQNGRCAYTNRSITIGIDAELDHIVPRSKGGPNTVENYQWLWAPVNRMKNNLSESEFWEVVRMLSKNPKFNQTL